MTTIQLAITFNQPFRIASGHGVGGIDDVVNRDNPLPATSLKGVLRDAARLVLPGTVRNDTYRDQELVCEVFGRRGRHEAVWHFSDARVDAAEDRYRSRTRVSIDEQRRARPGALFVGEELHIPKATATISQIGLVPEERKRAHVALLHLSARLVDGLGSDRRRGLGWVTITSDAPDDVATMIDIVRGSQA